MDYIGMGRRIRRTRRQHHLTQEQLAEKVDISPSFLGHVERGTRKASIETVRKICEVLKVSLDEIVGLEHIPLILFRELSQPTDEHLAMAQELIRTALFLVDNQWAFRE